MKCELPKVLMLSSVASMIGQFNMHNIRLLQEMGYEVHVACNFKEGNTFDQVHSDRLWQQLFHMHVVQHQWDCPRNITSAAKCLRAYRQIWELTGRYHFEYMHCHSPIGGVLARLAAHYRRICVIYTVHGFHFYRGAPVKNWILYYPVEKLLSYWTDAVITVNKEDYLFAAKNLNAEKLYYIPGVGVDYGRLVWNQKKMVREKLRRQYKIPAEAVLLLSVGELSRRKNHRIVLSALARLSRPDLYYMICGQGELAAELSHYAEKLGVSGHFRLTGYQEDVAQIYQAADLFVFPSWQEGMPVALMEAMAFGMPCLVSDIRGNRELIDKRAGGGKLCFDPDKPGQLCRRLESMLNDRCNWSKYGVHNQQKIRNGYGLDTVKRRMKKIYAQTYGAGGGVCGIKEKMTPDISVIMPVYNTPKKQVEAAVASILVQTYTDWELIICDDGSDTYTQKVLQRIAVKDPRIHLLRSGKNRRAGYARNQCIRESRGRYIAVMDADDLSCPDRLKIQRQYLEQHKEVDFVGCRGKFFVHRPGDDRELYWYCAKPEAEDFLFSLPYVHASMLFRREALQQVKGYDSSKRAVRAEDYDLLLRLYAAGMRGVNLPKVLYYIRRDEEQYRRRKYRFRFHEAYVKCRGFYKLGLMPLGIVYAAKPLLVGLIPVNCTKILQKYYYKHRKCTVNIYKKRMQEQKGYYIKCRLRK